MTTINKGRRKINDLIVQSNDLVEAYYETDLTTNEQKLIRYTASKIKMNDTELSEYTFEVREFANALGVRSGNYYSQIKKAADQLSKRRIQVKSKQKIGWFPWFQGIIYDGGLVHIQFNPIVKDLLIQLEKRFTNYSFGVISPLKSGYSIRIFELLKQYEKIGERTIELTELRKMLGLENKYPQYPNLKQRVIRPAQTELKEKTKLNFEFEEIKRGRRVFALKFIINSKYGNEQLSLFNEQNEDGSVNGSSFVKSVKTLLNQRDITVKEVDIQKWEEYGFDAVADVIEEIESRKNINNYYNYITKILSEKSKESTTSLTPNNNDLSDELICREFFSTKKNEIGPLPEFIIKESFIQFHRKFVDSTEDEATDFWGRNSELIVQKVKMLVANNRKRA